MRFEGDGHGGEPYEDHRFDGPSDTEVTRPFVRGEPRRDGTESAEPPRRDGGTAATAGERPQEFVRPVLPGAAAPDPSGESTRTFSRGGESDDGAADRTRTMARPAAPLRAPDPDDDDDGWRRSRDRYDEPPDSPDPYADRPRRRPRAGPKRRRRFRVRHAVALVVLLVIMAPFATWGWVWYTARQDDRTPSDAILVLGASQYNGRPSPIFEARLQHAADLYEQGVAPVIITVGGNQPGDNFTEGGSGAAWLAQAGVPGDHLIAVEEGRDTLQSFEAIAPIFAEKGWDSAVIVTDPWHSLRSRQMAGDHGIEEAVTSPARSGPAVRERETQLWYITRETASLWYYWIFGDSSDIEVDATR